MDEVDRKIISKLLENGRMSYVQIGKAIGYTAMGAKRRLLKMLNEGLIQVSAQINMDKLKLHAALVLLEFENREAAPCNVKCDICERYRANKCVG